LSGKNATSTDSFCDSGVEHHIQRKGHPLKRIKVRYTGSVVDGHPGDVNYHSFILNGVRFVQQHATSHRYISG
jgi:hypothetical protein